MPPMKQPTSSTTLYGGEVVLDFYAQFGRRKHVYCIGDIEVPSVTKILDVLDKPALPAWAVNEMEAHLLRECKPGMVVDEVNFPQLLGAAKSARFTKSDAGKTIGALAHDWIEQWVNAQINGTEAPERPVNEQLCAAIDSFLRWQEIHKVNWLRSEQKVYSRQYGYCGTFDFIAIIDGLLTLGDFKTTNVNKSTGSGIYPEYWLQTAAYQHAYQEEREHEDPDFRKVRIEQRMIVRLGKEPSADGGVEFEVKTSREFTRDFEAFLGTLAVHKAMASLQAGDGIAALGLDPALLALTQKHEPVRMGAEIAAAEAVAA